jgi:hypothetical protein
MTRTRRLLKTGRFAPIAVGLSGFWMGFLGAANAMSLKPLI